MGCIKGCTGTESRNTQLGALHVLSCRGDMLLSYKPLLNYLSVFSKYGLICLLRCLYLSMFTFWSTHSLCTEGLFNRNRNLLGSPYQFLTFELLYKSVLNRTKLSQGQWWLQYCSIYSSYFVLPALSGARQPCHSRFWVSLAGCQWVGEMFNQLPF